MPALPYFAVHNVDILPHGAGSALVNCQAAIHSLSVLLDTYSNHDKALEDGNIVGLAYLLRLLSDTLAEKVYGECVPLQSSEVEALLKEQKAKAAGKPDDEGQGKTD